LFIAYALGYEIYSIASSCAISLH